MRKKLFTPVFILIILTACTLFASAYTGPALLTDGADLLTSSEEERLEEKLELLSDKHSFDIAVMTSETLQGYYSAESAATELYELTGYSEDGIMLFISMADRDWYILTSGSCISSITYNETGYISEQFLPDLSNGYYLYAFETFAECSAEMSAEELYTDVYSDYDNYYDYNGYDDYSDYNDYSYNDYSYNDYTDTGYPLLRNIGIWLLVGFIAALIITGIMRGRLKTVRPQTQADNYIKRDSMCITESQDLFLYRNVVKHRRSNNSSGGGSSGGGARIHRSSSGRSYGGRGGKF